MSEEQARAITIRQADVNSDRQQVQAIFWEYFSWANDRNEQEFGIRLDIRAMLEDDMAHIDKFLPPYGRLLLALAEGKAVGCVCLKKLTDDIGEVKRLYVQPRFRGRGVAKSLVGKLIEQAIEVGYSTLRLDSARYMTNAHALYRSVGFRDIPPYPDSEIPAEYHPHWVFMELSLERV